MKKALRIYMKSNAKVKTPLSLWQKLWNPSLSAFLLKKAKSEGIEQAIYQNVRAGYTTGSNISYYLAEIVPPDFPVVLELIDDESKLHDFYNSIKSQLSTEKAYFIELKEPKIL